MSNFIEDCLAGNALLTDIDVYIDAWHNGDSTTSLHEYLGMTFEEYTAYIETDDNLPFIVAARKKQIKFNTVTNKELYTLAARTDDLLKVEKLSNWLKLRGLWE